MDHPDTLRLMVFLSLFALFAALKWLSPRRAARLGRARWATNGAIMLLGAVLLRLLALALPLLAIGAAVDAAGLGWGLFNALSWNPWAEGVLAVLVFEILLNGTALFNHANLALPRWLDRALRLLLVTPDMHRVHHSVHRAEHDSNYGFCLSIWDRLFGTYRAQPLDGHDGMIIGLEWQVDHPARLGWSLMLPFRK